MNRIEKRLAELKNKKQKTLIVYITAGDPNLKTTEKLILSFNRLNVGMIELGIPFSDPLADGKTNQLAAARSLKSGTTLKKILIMIKRIREKVEIPIVLFTYLNPILKYDIKKFAVDAKNYGVDGVLVLDLPPEESKEYCRIMKEKKISTIFLVAPTSTSERIKKISQTATGFIYCVTRTGVTGERVDMPKSVSEIVKKIKKYSSLPVALGFGISNPQHVKILSKICDAVVVGSAIVRKIEENLGKSSLIPEVIKLVKSLKKPLDSYGTH